MNLLQNLSGESHLKNLRKDGSGEADCCFPLCDHADTANRFNYLTARNDFIFSNLLSPPKTRVLF
jgi:hypothetical protein